MGPWIANVLTPPMWLWVRWTRPQPVHCAHDRPSEHYLLVAILVVGLLICSVLAFPWYGSRGMNTDAPSTILLQAPGTPSQGMHSSARVSIQGSNVDAGRLGGNLTMYHFASASPSRNSTPVKEVGTPIGSIAPRPYSGSHPELPDAVVYDGADNAIYFSNDTSFYNCSIIGVSGTTIVSEMGTTWCIFSLAYDDADGLYYATCMTNGGGASYNFVPVFNGSQYVGHVVNKTTIYQPCGAALNPSNGLLYVLSGGTSTGVSLVNGTNVVGAFNTTQLASSFTYDPLNGFLYVAFANSIAVLNGTTVVGTVAGTAPSGGADFAGIEDLEFDPVNQYMYATSYGGGTGSYATGFVTIFPANETNGSSIVAKIAVPSPGYGLHDGYVDPGNGLYYGETDNGAQMFVLNGTTVVNGSFKLGPLGYPFGMAYDWRNGVMYIANQGAENLTPLSTLLGIAPASVGPTGATDVGEKTVVSADLWAVGDGRDLAQAAVSPSTGFDCSTTPWTVLALNLSANVNLTCLPTKPGTYTVWINVTDGVPNTVWSETQVVVYQAPGITPISVSRNSLDLGQGVQFSVAAFSGLAGYTYSWTGLPTGCQSTTATFVCTPNETGGFAPSVTVTDANGYPVRSGPVQVTVDPDPTVALEAPATIDSSQGVDVAANASNGSGGFSFSWTGLFPGCSETNGPVLICPPGVAAGTDRFQVSVTDSNGFQVTSKAVTVVIYANPTLTPPNLSAVVSDVGLPVTGFVDEMGGSGGLVYTWQGLPEGLIGTGSQVKGTPSLGGSYPISVSVEDSNGVTAHSRTVLLMINPSPTAAMVGTTPTAVANESVTFVGLGSGGTGALTETWHFGDGGIGRGSVADHAYRTAGTYEVKLWVNDSLGESATATWNVSVTWPSSVVATPPPPPTIFGLSYGLFGVLAILGLADVVLAMALGWAIVRGRTRPPPI
jgi:hypothetical protein